MSHRKDFTQKEIIEAMEATRTKVGACRLLGICVGTLDRNCKSLGITAKVKSLQIRYASDEEKLDRSRDRSREYMRKVREAEPELARAKARASMKKTAERHGPEWRRRWNSYNRHRRAHAEPSDSESTEYDKIIRRDPCSICGAKEDIVVDHIVAIMNGGSGSWENLAALCRSCNSQKHVRDLLQFMVIRCGV